MFYLLVAPPRPCKKYWILEIELSIGYIILFREVWVGQFIEKVKPFSFCVFQPSSVSFTAFDDDHVGGWSCSVLVKISLQVIYLMRVDILFDYKKQSGKSNFISISRLLKSSHMHIVARNFKCVYLCPSAKNMLLN